MQHATEETARQFPRIALPNGMRVSWRGADPKVPARVKTLSMGGLFISVGELPPLGTKLKLTFEVPGGTVHADAIVREIVPCEGIGVEFTQMKSRDKLLLEKLLTRLLRQDC